MGSPFDQEGMEEDVPGTDRLSPARPTVGLEASELDMLRSAPDYDAEEMSTVRPPGGWPTVAAAPAAAYKPATPPPAAAKPMPAPPAAAKPPPAPWAPPNRVEPPVRTEPSAQTEPSARPASVDGAALPQVGERQRFPEERTVALMAEDLLGRPLDGPEVAQPPAASDPATDQSAVPMAAREFGLTAHGADLWDQVMPLVSEG